MNWCASVQFPKKNIPLSFQVIKPSKLIAIWASYHRRWLVFCEERVYFVPSELRTILLCRLPQNIFMKLWQVCPKVEHVASQLWNPPQCCWRSRAPCSFFCWGFSLQPTFDVGLRYPGAVLLSWFQDPLPGPGLSHTLSYYKSKSGLRPFSYCKISVFPLQSSLKRFQMLSTWDTLFKSLNSITSIKQTGSSYRNLHILWAQLARRFLLSLLL